MYRLRWHQGWMHPWRWPTRIASYGLRSAWMPHLSKWVSPECVLDAWKRAADLTIHGAEWVQLPSGIWTLDFDGSTDYCKIDDASQTGLDPGTDMFMFEAWVKPTTQTSRMLMNKGEHSGVATFYEFDVYVDPGTSTYDIGFQFRVNGSYSRQTWRMNYSDLDKWVFVGCLVGKEGSYRKVETRVKGADTVSLVNNESGCPATSSFDSDKPFFLGCGSYDGLTPTYRYAGRVGLVLYRNLGSDVPSNVWDIFEQDYQTTRRVFDPPQEESATPVTIWEKALIQNGESPPGYTFRTVIEAADITQGASVIQVTFEAASDKHFVIDNASIVERDGSTANGVEVPTELLFDGTSGVDIPAGQTAVSDPLAFTIDPNKDYLVIIDKGAGDSDLRDKYDVNDSGGYYYVNYTASYNLKDMPYPYVNRVPGGAIGVTKIEAVA